MIQTHEPRDKEKRVDSVNASTTTRCAPITMRALQRGLSVYPKTAGQDFPSSSVHWLDTSDNLLRASVVHP
jgi:hypothetical protein